MYIAIRIMVYCKAVYKSKYDNNLCCTALPLDRVAIMGWSETSTKKHERRHMMCVMSTIPILQFVYYSILQKQRVAILDNSLMIRGESTA